MKPGRSVVSVLLAASAQTPSPGSPALMPSSDWGSRLLTAMAGPVSRRSLRSSCVVRGL